MLLIIIGGAIVLAIGGTIMVIADKLGQRKNKCE